eukprot:TRINITY_DN3583_c0_g1_i3.p1 TRINITY_DN3583_c0_g1~~TRINITY_DN3583_c0_g1_i3.p1  ORF type:complete len:682 (-),score=84.77 TRINITY_DN3583_c0_g1_i3:266-2311(-)
MVTPGVGCCLAPAGLQQVLSLAFLFLVDDLLVAGASVKTRSHKHVSVSRPRFAKHYPPQDLLDCTGANFSSVWQEFLPQVSQNVRAGFPKDDHLLFQAVQLLDESRDQFRAQIFTMQHVLRREAPVRKLGGFCYVGFAVASFIIFRHTLHPTYLGLIEKSLHWSEWPLDFTESSAWPTLWRHASLHLEEYERRGDVSWSAELADWGDDERLLPRPVLSDVVMQLDAWLQIVDSIKFPWAQVQEPDFSGTAAALTLSRRLNHKRRVNVLVWGHHVGSSMEPFTMLREALRIGLSVHVEATFCGQRHPSTEMMCKEFGYCEKHEGIEAWSKRYEHQVHGEYWWMPDHWDHVQQELADNVRFSGLAARVEAVVCGGPAWLCVMLRSVWAVPMMLYFAWPIASLVPAKFKTRIFAQVRAIGEAGDPPIAFVAANWVLAAQFAVQTRLRVPVRRPHGLYTNQTYSPLSADDGTPRVMFTRTGQWSRGSGVALQETAWSFLEQARQNGRPYPFELVFLSIKVRGVDTTQMSLSYSDLSNFHACIFWPWDIMMLMFNELYTMTMPMLLPERRWMHHLMVHALRHTTMNWYHLRPQLNGRLPDVTDVEFPLPLPWFSEGAGLMQAAFWYELSDFAQFPHLTYFTSLPDMLDRTAALDVASVQMGMRIFNELTLQSSLTFYRRAVAELLR